jgi:methylated-DNA-[protein]-cysteine S-methyltransferase
MSRAEERMIRDLLGAELAAEAEGAARRLAERAEREGLADVAYATYESPLGTGAVAATDRGVVAISLPNRPVEDLLAELSEELSPRVLELPARLDGARRELDEYFAGRRRRFEMPLDWRLVHPGFYSRVLHATAKLPFGVTSTYGEIAAEAGNPRAYRAAGSALGHNPIPLVVPCHRVLRAGGDVGQYGGGREMKEFLLRLEGAIQGRPSA